MIFILFIISFVGLVVFFSLKTWELNTGKQILSINKLDKSDIFIRRSFVRLRFFYRIFLVNLNKIPIFFGILRKSILEKIKSLKDLIILKIVGYLNLDNVKNIEKNKGSVSLFLKNISENKEEK